MLVGQCQGREKSSKPQSGDSLHIIPTPCPVPCKKMNKSSFAIIPHFFHLKKIWNKFWKRALMFQTVKYPFLGEVVWSCNYFIHETQVDVTNPQTQRDLIFSTFEHSTWKKEIWGTHPDWCPTLSLPIFQQGYLPFASPPLMNFYQGAGPNQLICPKNLSFPCQDRDVKISTPPPTAVFS